ncbi:hypothetical protein CN193_14220 [Sinorhizobium meliloti]|uniref:hypothetical protein n=1 Tax=Rhizobium meliloti TaxID=382 RepID=UPI000FD94677|nr:hypothetical protein [Sinorhizobium meliloti]RVJ02418.1 hypothetical protein CN193_14220 [Sinorhizobium meliloti]
MISNRDKANCAAREVRNRKWVYARLVAEGRMKGDRADREIEIMAAIAEDYRRMAEAEEAQERLPL